jgi:hypothetical protein
MSKPKLFKPKLFKNKTDVEDTINGLIAKGFIYESNGRLCLTSAGEEASKQAQ